MDDMAYHIGYSYYKFLIASLPYQNPIYIIMKYIYIVSLLSWNPDFIKLGMLTWKRFNH